MTEISSLDWNWQRKVKQILDDTRHEPISRISERICERGHVFICLSKASWLRLAGLVPPSSAVSQCEGNTEARFGACLSFVS